MIHNWAEEMQVRPRSVAQVEEGGLFLNNYICMKPVRSLQMYPTTHLWERMPWPDFTVLLLEALDVNMMWAAESFSRRKGLVLKSWPGPSVMEGKFLPGDI